MADRIVQLTDQEDNKVYPVIAGSIYPIGSIYMSVNNINPATIFGGTWQQIKDTFLLACGDTYVNGSTGGEATHTLTVDEMPSHNHGYFNTPNDNGGYTYWVPNTSVYRKTSYQTNMSNTGGGQAHNNMPPYLAVYVWVRTA